MTGRSTDAVTDTLDGLAMLRLRVGEAVRWRSGSGGRWRYGTVARRERDGSIGVTDADGASRSLEVDRLEVGCVGERGGRAWELLTRRACSNEQLTLLPFSPPDGGRSAQ